MQQCIFPFSLGMQTAGTHQGYCWLLWFPPGPCLWVFAGFGQRNYGKWCYFYWWGITCVGDELCVVDSSKMLWKKYFVYPSMIMTCSSTGWTLLNKSSWLRPIILESKACGNSLLTSPRGHSLITGMSCPCCSLVSTVTCQMSFVSIHEASQGCWWYPLCYTVPCYMLPCFPKLRHWSCSGEGYWGLSVNCSERLCNASFICFKLVFSMLWIWFTDLLQLLYRKLDIALLLGHWQQL